ncbi:response regulator receiver domain-containing protein [Anseongella ginsenosidimutans]|uniref:Response regulator receiver domain-containing protein n=1 Tax=Anseongella ginsenosidimutans TaxID=496056 RepID=A0A4V2UU95_9SPHI|nr:bifunctional response regulator/alkaline phosphatase family protein [Anseongella ginsenosidimutans]QEC51440.1 bifunctional response regulator/alkaline phosphatase family protein [Anseongella ginsenosidimutans]TCS89853.1 response regulator receiver domain-containing protein [Anseongella ginsenosidimutans]
MQETTILWADDEIDLLKPHILFLNDKGYKVKTVTNGSDALDAIKTENFDLIFLDENMPGLTGLETLAEVKSLRADLPVVLITKNEDEPVMEDAIGAQIDDYLIKPVNPKQVLLTIKKILDNKRLVTAKTTSAYQQDFMSLGLTLNDNLSFDEWTEVYKKLIYWELQLDRLEDTGMLEILTQQKAEANMQFSKFVEKNYLKWVQHPEDGPTMSHNLLANRVFPLLDDTPTFFVLIDNLRYDQWKVIQPIISEYFRFESEECYYSILPTATQYARNAIFSGLMPLEMEKQYPNIWQNDEDEGGKNMYEEDFLYSHIQRMRKPVKFSYTKVLNYEAGRELMENVHNILGNSLNAVVYNFVDTLSHARTEMEILKELASDEAAYRSLTLSWFEHSPLLDALKRIADKKVRLIITTDHGTIRVRTPSKVIGDRNTNTNLRYKTGKNLAFDAKDVMHIRNPHEALLPRQHVSSSYIFAKEDEYFVYQNNYNQFVQYYLNTFQHGGISLEEMIIPFAIFSSK